VAAHTNTWSPWARDYARHPHEYVFGTTPSAFAPGSAAAARAGDRVLELGCGEGGDSVFFAGFGCDVTAVDVAVSITSRAGNAAYGCVSTRAHVDALRPAETPPMPPGVHP
jgi:hypothetical protein